jgi:hypothetical protein
MTEPREVELWPCGYTSRCSALGCRRLATAVLRYLATRDDSIVRQTLATSMQASCALK